MKFTVAEIQSLYNLIGGWISAPTVEFIEECQGKADGTLASHEDGNILHIRQERNFQVTFLKEGDYWIMIAEKDLESFMNNNSVSRILASQSLST